MDLSTIVTNAIISASIQTIISVVIYKAVQRQDHKIDGMGARIQELEDKRLGDINSRLNSGAKEFDDIHDEMGNHVSRPDYLLHQERCDSKMKELTDDVDAIREKQAEIGSEVSGIHAIVELIARNLNISLK